MFTPVESNSHRPPLPSNHRHPSCAAATLEPPLGCRILPPLNPTDRGLGSPCATGAGEADGAA
eukprot:6434425-Prymnesium_polylepis.1